MSITVVRAHKLAHMIEWLHARELSRRSKRTESAAELFDPHAATELGNLIYNYCNNRIYLESPDNG